MPEAEYVRFKDGAGFRVPGSVSVEMPSEDDTHMRRTFYVVSQLESPRWGSVQNYDKAGMSAGPLHATAVLPGLGKQGKLWGLVGQIIAQCEYVGAVRHLHRQIELAGWRITHTGTVVHAKNGKEVEMEILRARISALHGNVPSFGLKYESAKEWALAFHHVFANASTFVLQELFAIDWLVRGQKTTELAAYMKYMTKVMNKRDAYNFIQYAAQADLGSDLDLAMIVYHAFSVNAPAPALKALRTAIETTDPEEPGEFARRLIAELGTTPYGRWHDTADGKNRYDKTREVCSNTGYWNEDRFDLLMPENLK